MADGTRIEWADATVNAINGCSVTSPGCTNCYAMKLAGTRMKTHPTRAGMTVDTKAGPVWNGEVRLHEPSLLQPLSWTKPRRIFWNAHGDTFHDAVPDEWIDRIFAVAALTPQHTHMILTKRSKRMREYCTERLSIGAGVLKEMRKLSGKTPKECCVALLGVDEHTPVPPSRPLPNVWLGVSVENRDALLNRATDLGQTPAAIRFWSAEPLLEDLGQINPIWLPDWVIVGGESGPGARPMHPDWARSLRDQCAAAGVPFHFKQWGEWAPVASWPSFRSGTPADVDVNDKVRALDAKVRTWRVGKKRAGRLLDGVEHNGMPEVQHG